MDIGFIGLGNMGAEMAANLLGAGHRVTAYNRSAEKVSTLAERGAAAAASIADACRGECVVTMLADDGAVEAVSLSNDGIVSALSPGAVHISCSTISAALTDRLADAHAAAGQRFVSAPVFGRPEAAAAAKLFVIAAGDAAAVTDAGPVFDAIGQRTFVVSETPRAATLIKLSGNFLIASVIEALSEAMALVADGARRVRTRRLRRHTRTQRCPAGAGRGRRAARSVADRQFGARQVLDLDRQGRR